MRASPGCYGLGTFDDPTAYIGQSVHIGNRVAQHVRGKVKTTKDFLTNIITNNSEAGRVTLWTMDDKTIKYLQENSITIDVFLLVLERRRLFSLVIVHMLIKY